MTLLRNLSARLRYSSWIYLYLAILVALFSAVCRALHRPEFPARSRQAGSDRCRRLQVHGFHPYPRPLGRRGGEWRVRMGARIRFRRSGKQRPRQRAHSLPSGLDLQIANRRRRTAALGARQARSRCPRAKVLPCIPSKTLAHLHSPGARDTSEEFDTTKPARTRRTLKAATPNTSTIPSRPA